MSLAMLTDFLELCLLINAAILLLTTVSIYFLRDFLLRTHKAMFNLSEVDLANRYFAYLAQFKLLVLVFNFTPYLVLKFLL